MLDEAVDLLGEKDRLPIVLRFFEQLDFRAMGLALGTTSGMFRGGKSFVGYFAPIGAGHLVVFGDYKHSGPTDLQRRRGNRALKNPCKVQGGQAHSKALPRRFKG